MVAVTVHYSNADWKEIRTSSDNIELSDITDNDNTNSIISSVIKIELIDGNTTINLSNGTIQIEFMIQSTEGFPPTDGSSEVHCVYQVNDSVWSTEGLEVVSVDSEMAVCNSTHLTSFAVLLSLRPPDGVHAQVQSYLSYILGGISIASLTLAVFIYCVTG
nr:latrophilin-like protein LAT-2 [Lytechinus pictus]